MPDAFVTLLVFCGLFMVTPATAAAQDLFELEVFEYELTLPGTFDVDVHTNVMSRGGVMLPPAAGKHHPVHLSVDMADPVVASQFKATWKGWRRR